MNSAPPPVRTLKGVLTVEDTPLARVAETAGTPTYCYSTARLTANLAAWQGAMDGLKNPKGFTICYAVKANGNQAILRLLARLGAGADIVSGGELARARAAKIPGKRIVYSGLGKTDAELTAAIKTGLLQINVESETELARISRLAVALKTTARVALRVNPDVDARTHAKITTGRKGNKFGIDIDQAAAIYDRARRLPGIEARGVAVHIGSQLLSLNPYARAYRRVAALVRDLRSRGHVIDTVDLGGGLGVAYKGETPPTPAAYAEIVRRTILPLGVHIVVEPGRSLVADAGLLLSRVIDVKKTPHKTFVVLDAAMNDLMRPALYDAYHAILPCRPARGGTVVCDVVGPVCESSDVFLSGARLPRLKTGDLVAIMTAGAYGAAMSSTYNARPLAAEVLVSGRKIAVVRPRKSVADLIAEDAVPAWLS